jgi:hypothetical protein
LLSRGREFGEKYQEQTTRSGVTLGDLLESFFDSGPSRKATWGEMQDYKGMLYVYIEGMGWEVLSG